MHSFSGNQGVQGIVMIPSLHFAFDIIYIFEAEHITSDINTVFITSMKITILLIKIE